MVSRCIVFILLIIMLVLIPVTNMGCQEEEPAISSHPNRMGLSSTLVPDTGFDLYVYIKQQSPTVIFKDVIGTPSDVAVVSMAIWGIPDQETYALSGGLEFASSAEAADVYHQLSGETETWTLLSQERIYFAHGFGAIIEGFSSIISSNKFKYYDDEDAMAELALFPDNGTMKLTGVAIAKPSPTLVDVIIRNTTSEATDLLDVILNSANLEIITAGLYSQQQMNISPMIENPELGNILASGVGVLASARSAWSGLVVGPIVQTALENAGYEKTIESEFTFYKGYLALGLEEDIPIFFRVEDNRLFVAVSLQESYARLLISNIID